MHSSFKLFSVKNPRSKLSSDLEELKPRNDRKMLRKVFRDKADPRVLNEKMKFSQTYSGKASTWQDSGKSELFISQETISSTQGLLHTVLHQPRLSTLDKELVIVNVEGIIANYYNREVTIRGESVHFLKELNGRYQVVLVSGWKIARFLKLISYLSSKGIYISAAYKLVASGGNTSEEFDKKRHDWYLDYNRVYKDFKICQANVRKVVVFVPFVACPEDVEDNFVANHSGALRPTFYAKKVPVPTLQFPFAPVTFFIPHMGHVALNLAPVTEAVKQLLSIKSVQSFYHSNFTVFTCNTIHKELLYLYCLPRRNDCIMQTFLLLKSGGLSDVVFLHRENYIQRLNCESLLDFTLNSH
jgi:hypothetical protein